MEILKWRFERVYILAGKFETGVNWILGYL